jgi:fatty-acyl-CoA synthase
MHQQITDYHPLCHCEQASALSGLGVGRGDTVAILSPNTPAFVEVHHGVNACGAVVNPLNTRLDASTLAYILEHSECKVLLADTAFAETTRKALDELAASGTPMPVVVDLIDPVESLAAPGRVGDLDYEALLATGSSEFSWLLPEDEWESQALNYTSGTTGRPKGVLYHHRGAALNAINNALIWGLEIHPKCTRHTARATHATDVHWGGRWLVETEMGLEMVLEMVLEMDAPHMPVYG